MYILQTGNEFVALIQAKAIIFLPHYAYMLLFRTMGGAVVIRLPPSTNSRLQPKNKYKLRPQNRSALVNHLCERVAQAGFLSNRK